MNIINAYQIRKYHGANLILDSISFDITAGDRVGLIGRNGSGKTTLLQLLAGRTQPDEGALALQKGVRVGVLDQIPAQHAGRTVYDVLSLGLKGTLECGEALAAVEQHMSSEPLPEGAELERLLAQYAALQERFEREGGYEIEARMGQVANGLGIPQEQLQREFATLSGGERTRVCLASLLIERPDVLLLDEPTNHLDLHGTEWLEGFLTSYSGTCLIVSHDRYFLDRVVTKVIELEDGEALTYLADYTGYVREKEERLLQQFADYQEQQKKIKQMKDTIKQLHEWGRVGGNEKFFRRAASMQKALDRMEKVKRPILERKRADFELQLKDRSGRRTVIMEGVQKRYGARVILNGADGLLQYGEKAALIGENGAGKTTLFKLLLGLEPADGGKVELGAKVDAGYLAQEDKPELKTTILKYFCEEAKVEEGEGRGLLARFLFYGADVFKSIESLSGGEWTRLRLALLMLRQPNLLLLDEPTNHLDIASREALEEALEEFQGTVLAISHDRYFMNRLAESIWELRDGKITRYIGNFEDYREKAVGRTVAAPAAAQQQPVAKPVAVQRKMPAKADSSDKMRQRTEGEIAQLERDLAGCQEKLGDPAHANDSAQLAQWWAEQERLQRKLGELYEAWLEI